MEGFLPNLENCSHPEYGMGEENFFGPTSFSAFRSFNEREEIQNLEEEEEVKIVSCARKRAAPKTKATPSKKTTPRKKVAEIEPKLEGEDEDSKAKWRHSDVEALIALRGEMEPEFVRNGKKQGIDTWVKLHARMVAMIPNFTRSSVACKKKFSSIFKQYKEDKLANGISGNDRRECQFFDSMDEWWHQAGQVMKHVSATTDNSKEIGENCTPDSTTDASIGDITPASSTKGKLNFHQKAIDIFEKMAENSVGLLKHFEKTNQLLERVDYQMDRLIDKL